MKSEIIKIFIVFLVVIGLVFFGLNYIFFNKSGPTTKATGETMNVSFNNKDPVSMVLNGEFTVTLQAKPSINTILRGYHNKIIFDKSKLKFMSITYNTGVVSSSLGDTNADADSVNARGSIYVVAEDQTASGYVIGTANGAELVTVTFKVLDTTGTVVQVSDAEFYTINSDLSLFNGWIVTTSALDINGGLTELTSTPTPTPTIVSNSPTPTPTPTGASSSPTPTPTGSAGNINLNLKLKFQGINQLPATGQNSMLVKAIVYKEGDENPHNGNGTFIADANGIWTGTINVNFATVADKYRILIKGAQHIQKKICIDTPTEAKPGSYNCATGNITLVNGDNNLNFSGIMLLVGDLDQNGIVDSVDFALVKNNLGKHDASTLTKADLNRDGIVNTQDFSLILAALAIRTDEL